MLWRPRPDLFLNQYVLIEKLGEGGMGEVFVPTTSARGVTWR